MTGDPVRVGEIREKLLVVSLCHERFSVLWTVFKDLIKHPICKERTKFGTKILSTFELNFRSPHQQIYVLASFGRCPIWPCRMSVLGQKQTSETGDQNVCFTPESRHKSSWAGMSALCHKETFAVPEQQPHCGTQVPVEEPSTASLENIRKSGRFKHLNVANMEK